MQKQWIVGVVLAAALAVCPVVGACEQISDKLLKEAKEKVLHIERLISKAKEGDAVAQFDLGIMILNEGPKYVMREIGRQHMPDEDSIKAALKEVDDASLEWLLRAAMQDHDLAQWVVAKRYEQTDIVRAYAWNLVQVRKGRNPTSTRDGVERTRAEWMLDKMSQNQVAEAERLSRELERSIKRRPEKDPQ